MELRFGSVCSGVEMASVAWGPLGWKPAFFSEIDAFPCALLAHRYPDVPNFGDLTKLDCVDAGKGVYEYGDGERKEVGPIDILVGGTPCFPAGTPVLTKRGYRPIEKLKVGDEVISGSGRIRKVTATGSKMAEVGNLRILGKGIVMCTPNHPFQVWKDDGSDDFVKTRADECAGLRCKLVGRVEDGGYPNRDVARLCGWFIRRGHFSGEGNYIYIVLDDREYEEFVSQGMCFVEGVMSEPLVYHVRDGTPRYDIRITPSVAHDWISRFMLSDEWGVKRVKVIPPGFHSGPDDDDDVIDMFIDGLFGPDRKVTKICRLHKATAYGLADLLAGSVVTPDSDGTYNVILHRGDDRYDERLIHGAETTPIRRFTNAAGEVRVYNITVDVEHTYVVCGCAVGNCQSFSKAGKCEGLEGVSGLVRSYFRVLEQVRPKVFVWENVKGCLSSDGGTAFKFIIDQFTSCGYSCAWRLLDSQYVRVDGFPRAVPQRRQRLFVVGCLDAPWDAPAEILFDPGCEPGDNPPERREGKETGRETEAWIGLHFDNGPERGEAPNTVCVKTTAVRRCFDYHGNDCRVTPTVVAPTLAACNGDHLEGKEVLVLDEAAITDDIRHFAEHKGAPVSGISLVGLDSLGNVVNELMIASGVDNVARVFEQGVIRTVRRMMPEETELLMGLPVGYTRVPYNGMSADDCRDPVRFKACGNGFSVNVMRWIGDGIDRAAVKYNLFGRRS